MPLRERYALEDAERDCKAAHAAAWDRYLAERTASPPAMPERLEARMSDEDTEAELGRYAAPGRPALIDHGAVACRRVPRDRLRRPRRGDRRRSCARGLGRAAEGQ